MFNTAGRLANSADAADIRTNKTLRHISPKMSTSPTDCPLVCQKAIGRVANNADPDQMPEKAASYLCLNYLFMPVW